MKMLSLFKSSKSSKVVTVYTYKFSTVSRLTGSATVEIRVKGINIGTARAALHAAVGRAAARKFVICSMA